MIVGDGGLRGGRAPQAWESISGETAASGTMKKGDILSREVLVS